MKKFIKLLTILTIFVLGISNVYALDISISNIKILDKSDTITVGNTSVNGLSITPNITFNQVNDYVIYMITFKGNDINNYKINNIKDNNSNEYIKTLYKYDGNLNNPLYITIAYDNQLNDSLVLNNINTIIELINKDGNIQVVPNNSSNNVPDNPKTGTFLYIVIPLILLVVSILLTIKYRKDKEKMSMMILIFTILMIPIGVIANEAMNLGLIIKTDNIKIANIVKSSSSSSSSLPPSSSNPAAPSSSSSSSGTIGTGYGGMNDCNGHYYGTKYNLSDNQITQLSRMVYGEYGSDINGMKAVASHMGNLYELRKYLNLTGSKGLFEYITTCGWYATDKHINNSKYDNADARQAVIDVLVNGNRTLPLYIDEFDWYPNDISGASSIYDYKNYTAGVTKLNNIYGATGTYYCVTIGNGAKDGNIFFYTSRAENYKNVMGY